MIRQFSYLLLFILLLLFVSSARGQGLSLPVASTYKLFQNETEWGSSARFVNDLLLDSEGLLWLGTNSGLIRWDGQRESFFNDRVAGKRNAVGKTTHRLFELNDGDLLLLSQEGFLELDVLEKKSGLRQQVQFPESAFERRGFIADVAQDSDGALYALVNQGSKVAIYRYSQLAQMELMHQVSFPVDIMERTIYFAVHQNTCWLAVDQLGVWKCNADGVEQIVDYDALGATFTHFIHADQKGRFWLGINSGENLYLFSETAQQFLPYKTPEGIAFRQIKEDRSGNLLFANDRYPNPLGPVYLLKDTQWVEKTNQLSSIARNLFPAHDAEQFIFQTTINNIETVSFSNPRVHSYIRSQPKGQWGNIIKGIAEDLAGNIYFLEEVNGFYRLNVATGEVEKIPIVDASGREFNFRCGGSLHIDRKGDFWFKFCDQRTTGFFLIRYRTRENKFDFYPIEKLPRDIVLDADDQVWITAHNTLDRRGGITRFDPNNSRFYPLSLNDENGLNFFAEPRFIQLTQDSILWVGTMEGLVRVNKQTGKQRVYNAANSRLQFDYVILIEPMSSGELLLGTSGGGLQVFNPETGAVKSYYLNGTSNPFVCGALPVDSTHWWLSTFNGLAYWDADLDVFTEFGENTLGFSHYEFNRYAYLKSRDGKFYFGNVNGVSAFYTEELLGKGPAPALGLHSVEQFFSGEKEPLLISKGLKGKKRLVLSPGVTEVQFDFYLGDYVARENSKVQVKLEGYDETWQATDAQKQITYRFLPAREYKLIARGFSGRGVPATNLFSIDIVVQTPLYLRWWFMTLCLIGFLALVWIISGLRVNRLQKIEAEKREINRKLAAFELEALRAQLNPHFVSNALGAIQHTIRERDMEKAEDILTKFAHLMRLFLESSKKKYISLAEEIELLRHYVEIEQLRFTDRFDFSLQLSQKIDPYAIEIPSLLFQPFLENAINHGLFHKKGRGHLRVVFAIDELGGELYCAIEDDGVGRKKAAKIKRQSIRNYRSRATQIVNERLEILRSVEGMDLEITITDLYDGETAAGTRVEIRIPVE